ncbi:hypothetical protein JRG66_09075 [Salinimicrobium tongyeongense]|uniref:EF-hand domain-containing protein n=1 Tax=Salinimicrobium tongyeongense TaxID=2809707 RepID=A0ABY6NMM9_9FLAO|nr:hypothetical protein [Salinimicrobium tongyeongense]UZH54150.1 hypothetical protein JRG66_09075 [Salinimicrobium tongyeongense]
MMNRKLFSKSILTILIFGLACGQDGEGAKLYKAFNKDQNNNLNDEEFLNAIAEMDYFGKWDQNRNGTLSEEEWYNGVNDFLGGYQISAVEEFGEWDLDGNNKVSMEEFNEGLFEVADKDINSQITKKEFIRLYKEGGGKKGKTN